jgi:hypothetical protein
MRKAGKEAIVIGSAYSVTRSAAKLLFISHEGTKKKEDTKDSCDPFVP